MKKQSRTALISLYDKTGLTKLARGLRRQGYQLLSTGGTARALRKAKIPVRSLSRYTGSPELLDGRVKSLHPKIHAGILARRDDPQHLAQLRREGIETIDLVAVNLYPFPQNARRGRLSLPRMLELIDIGGVALLRAAAKNFQGVIALSAPDDYVHVLNEMEQSGGELSSSTRRSLARKAFSLTSRYDAAVSQFLAEEGEETFPPRLELKFDLVQQLRYGENPHQQAAIYSPAAFRGGVSLLQSRQYQGKQLSYNNYLDLESGLNLVLELEAKAAVIIKHTNPCGAAESDNLLQSYRRARKTDPLSAFGSIVAFNGRVTPELAREITSTFVEAVIAPSYQAEALRVFSRKKNLRIMATGRGRKRAWATNFRSLHGGLLVQDEDGLTWRKDRLRVVTRKHPTARQWADLFFAWKVCKLCRSNAIVYARRRATVGVGCGQMSRIDAACLGALKAEQAGLKLKGSVLASDAFFPFRDVVDFAAEAGVGALVQPGGSIRDKESIAAADEHGLAMVFTGIRHFRH